MTRKGTIKVYIYLGNSRKAVEYGYTFVMIREFNADNYDELIEGVTSYMEDWFESYSDRFPTINIWTWVTEAEYFEGGYRDEKQYSNAILI